jgi:NAD-dependent deacetylase
MIIIRIRRKIISNMNNSFSSCMMEKYAGQLEPIFQSLGRDTRVIVLTGAGISAESGVPTFRGKGGLWEKYDPTEVATAEALRSRPHKVWEMHDALRQVLAGCKPNPGHYALVELEKIFQRTMIITQNVDNFHQDAGSSNVLELHGNAWRVKCTAEDRTWEDRRVPIKDLPPKCECGSIIRPDVVFFNEPLDSEVIDTAMNDAAKAEIMLVVGTSWVVYPAMYLPVIAKENNAVMIEINLEPTPLSPTMDISLFGKSGEVLPELVDTIKGLKK